MEETNGNEHGVSLVCVDCSPLVHWRIVVSLPVQWGLPRVALHGEFRVCFQADRGVGKRIILCLLFPLSSLTQSNHYTRVA